MNTAFSDSVEDASLAGFLAELLNVHKTIPLYPLDGLRVWNSKLWEMKIWLRGHILVLDSNTEDAGIVDIIWCIR